MALSQAIYGRRGELLLRSDAPLSQRQVAHLRNLGGATVYLSDGPAEVLSLADVVGSRVRERATHELGRIHAQVAAALSPMRALSPDELGGAREGDGPG